MSFLGAALGGIGDSIVGGLFNANEANKNREFQERMAKHQYQYAAEDLAKAGLNRVLALGSPTPTPPGAVAAPIDGPFEKAARINSAKASAELLREQIRATEADALQKTTAANLNISQDLKAQQDTLTSAAQAEYYRQLGRKVPVEAKLVNNQADALVLDATVGTKAVPLLNSVGHWFSRLFNRKETAKRAAEFNRQLQREKRK